MGVKKRERVLVFTDRPSGRESLSDADRQRRAKLRDIAILAGELGHNIAGEVSFLEFPSTGSHAKEPPKKVWEAAFGKKCVSALERAKVLGPIMRKRASEDTIAKAFDIVSRHSAGAVDAVIALSNYSTSHTRFRSLLCSTGTRYASMPIFEARMLEGSMTADWRQVAKRTEALARILSNALSVEIRAPNGTSVSFSIKGRRAASDTGIITRKGSFGNLPAGEAYIAPVEGTAEGRLVLEWAPLRKLASPVVLSVKNGMVSDVEGSEPFAGELRKRLQEREENRNIAELGIGTNEKASNPDNILESEKILGTIHMALGDNSSFGGTVKAQFHQDFVFFKPTVILCGRDGKKTMLMADGRFGPEG